MKAEDLVLNQGCKGKVVEKVREILPDISIAIFAEAFIIEAVDLGDLARFVVSAKDCYSLRVSDFESNKEGDRLDTIVASVDVVPCNVFSIHRA